MPPVGYTDCGAGHVLSPSALDRAVICAKVAASDGTTLGGSLNVRMAFAEFSGIGSATAADFASGTGSGYDAAADREVAVSAGDLVVLVGIIGSGGGFDAADWHAGGTIPWTLGPDWIELTDGTYAGGEKVGDGHPLVVTAYQVASVDGTIPIEASFVNNGSGPWPWAILGAVYAGVATPPVPGPVVGVYDKDDVFLDTLEGAYDVQLRVELDNVGSGSFKIRRDDPKATAELLRPGNFVRAAIPQIDSDPIVGFFLEDGDFKLVSSGERGGEVLAFSGKGTPSYLTRAIWLAESFLVNWWPAYKEAEAGPPAVGDIGALALADDPGWYYHYTVSGSTVTGKTLFHTAAVTPYYDQRRVFTRADGSKITLVHFSDTVYAGFWVHPFGAGVRDYRKASVYAFGNSVLMSNIGTGTKPGETLRAMYDEVQAADRPINPWPLLTVDFDDTDDSDGSAWSTTDALAGVSAELGEDYLSTIAKLIATGVLDIDLGPDFLLHAYNAPWGRDLAAASFASGKVRFQKGVNIADDLSREYSDPPVGTFAEAVGSEDGAIGRAILPTASDWRPREIHAEGDTTDSTTLDAIAAAELAFRLLHSDAVAFNVNTPVVGAEDELAGLYLPGPRWTARGNYWIGDFVRLHTGTEENDFDEETLRIAAITMSFTESNDLRAIPELISTLGGADDLGFGGGSGSSGSGVGGSGSSSTTSDLYQAISERDQPNGYPSLNEDGKVPFTELDLDWHPSVRAASLSNVTRATLDAGDSFGGVTVAEGDDVALLGQTTGSENGIYTIQASGTAPTRRGDFDDGPDVVGAVFLIREGTLGASIYYSTNATEPTIGTTALTFARVGTPPTGAAGGDLSGTYPNPSVVDDSHDHATLVKALTNKSGASVAAGDVVVLSAANADAFTTTVVAQATMPIGVALEAISNNASGRVAIAGYVAFVNTGGSTFGLRTYLETNGSAKQATANTTVRQGSFGVVLGTGANPDALLFGTTDQGGGSGLTDPMTTRGDLIVRNASNATDRLAVGSTNKVLHSDGTDPSWQKVVEADLGLTDVTTANASTSAHGFLKKLPGGTTTFLRADGSFAAPPGGGGGVVTDSYVSAAGAGGAVIPGLLGSPDVQPGSPHASDEEFDAALGGAWTAIGTLAASDANSTARSHLYLRSTGTTLRIDGYYKTLPALPITVTAKVTAWARQSNVGCRGIFIGAAGGAGKCMSLEMFASSGGNIERLDFTNPTTYAGTNTNIAYTTRGPIYLRFVINSATSVDSYFSDDGVIWNLLVAATNPGFTPAIVGLYANSFNGGTNGAALFDWIRFT